MRPLTAITGIVLGSCFAISVSLAAVFFIYLVLGDQYPRVQQETRPLAISLVLFVGMTAISGGSFYTQATKHRAAGSLQFLMWAGLAGLGCYYWP